MPYSKTSWVANVTPVTAASMNNIEAGIAGLSAPAPSATPPASPADGDIWYMLVTTAFYGGTVWQFRYNAGSASAYKWEFVGGADLQIGPQGGSSSMAGTTFTEMFGGPRATVSRSGDYIVEFGAYICNIGSGYTGPYNFAVDAPGSVAGAGATPLTFSIGAAWSGGHGSIATVRTNVAGGQYFYIAGKADRASTVTDFTTAWLKVRPIRVS